MHLIWSAEQQLEHDLDHDKQLSPRSYLGYLLDLISGMPTV